MPKSKSTRMTANLIEVSRKFVASVVAVEDFTLKKTHVIARSKGKDAVSFFFSSQVGIAPAQGPRKERTATQKAYPNVHRRSGRGPIWAAGPLLRSGCRRTGAGELPGALRRLGLDPASPGLPNAARSGADSIGRLCRRPRALRSGSKRADGALRETAGACRSQLQKR